MSTHKYIDFICVAVLVCTVLLTVLFINGRHFGLEAVLDGDAANSTDSAWFTRNDRNGDWSLSGAASITLAGDHARVFGGGAYAYGGDVIIAQPGRYVVSGTLEDGSIVVNADSGDKVWIMLDGADITCSDDACLRVDQADKVFLTLAEGSENSLSGGGTYSEEAVADKRNSVLFSHDDLTINGSGSLRILAASGHGVDVNDTLVITGGTLSIEAPGDAIHVNDGLRIENASLSLKAGDEGVDLQGEESILYISSGSLDIESTGSGVKCADAFELAGGSLDILSEGDGVHAGGSFTMTDGSLHITSGDDGIHADKTVSVAGGRITISECYEGIEALTIDLTGGDITIYPGDDGLNANGGSDRFGPPGMFGDRAPTGDGTEDEETWIHIGGGTLTIVNNVARDADGLDSNGDIYITGGTVFISLTNAGSNSAIDYGSESGGVCEISGGEVVACGSYMMAEGFSSGSTQCSILYNISYGIPAGTEVMLEDAEGNVLLRYTPPCAFSSVSLSSPGMKLGETYTVVIGEKEEHITLEEVSASYGDVRSEGFGGNMNFGQMHRRDGMPRDERPEDAEDMRPMPSEIPPRPEMNGMPPDFDGEMPGGDGERPAFSPMPMGVWERPEQTPAAEEVPADGDAEEIPTGPRPVNSETWIMLGACALVLILGLLFAIRYKR